jgi:hypothetical protein
MSGPVARFVLQYTVGRSGLDPTTVRAKVQVKPLQRDGLSSSRRSASHIRGFKVPQIGHFA